MMLMSQGGLQYWQVINSIQPASMLYNVPLWEAAGLVAQDVGPNHLAMSYSAVGITYGQAGVGDGKTAIDLDGTGYIGSYSAALGALWNGLECSVGIWIKVSTPVWGDGIIRYAHSFGIVDTTMRVNIQKRSLANTMQLEYSVGGVRQSQDIVFDPLVDTGWIHLMVTVSDSNDRFRAFLNGAQYGADQNGIGSWVGALTSSYTGIGSRRSTSANLPWVGGLAYATAWAKELSPAEVATVASPFSSTPIGVMPVGDSKTLSASAGITALLNALTASTGQLWVECPYRIAVSGLTTATLTANIDAYIAAIPAAERNLVRWIPYNMGANDAGLAVPPTKAVWKANTDYNLQALMTGFPHARIGLAKVWRRADEAQIPGALADYAEARTELIAAYPSRVFAGPDEDVVLEAGDNGATWTSDGVHPTNPAGYVREWTAALISWRAAMGV